MDDSKRAVKAAAIGLVIGAGYLAPMKVPPPAGLVAAVLVGVCAGVGVSLLLSSRTLRARQPWATLMAAVAIVAALVMALSVPLAKVSYPDVQIMATGQKNPASKSSEVFVHLESAPIEGVHGFEGDNWERRGEVFVSYQKQPSVLHYRGTWAPGAALRIVRHPYSGIAEVSIGGNVQRLDLFSETQTFIDVPLPEARPSWKSYYQRAMIAVGLGLLFAGIGMAMVGRSLARGGVFALVLMAASTSLWLVKDRFAAQATPFLGASALSGSVHSTQ